MSADTPNFYRNEKHAKSQAREIVLCFQITAAKTVVPLPRGIDCLTAFDALTQPQIDAYLSRPMDGYVSTSATGFTAAQFDATSMGTNVFGGIVNMNQQAGYCSYLAATLYTGGSATTVLAEGATGLAASSLTNGVARSPAGDLAFRAILTGVDAATSGLILVKIGWISV